MARCPVIQIPPILPVYAAMSNSESEMLNIRTFRNSDTEAVHRLFAGSLMDFAEGYQEGMQSYVNSSLADDLADIPTHYLADPGSHFWVAEIAGLIKGMVGIQRISEDEAELRRMSVAAENRRQGVGRGLLRVCETFCWEQGYRRIKLTTVHLLQPAIAMYRSYGYQLVDEEQYGQLTGLHFIKHLEQGNQQQEGT